MNTSSSHSPSLCCRQDAARLLDSKLSRAIYLAHECRNLPLLLAENEQLLDVEPASVGAAKPGLLAVTDRRLIHLYFRRLLRCLKVTEISYERVNAVDAQSWRSMARLRVRFNQFRSTIDFPISTGGERASELAACIREARSKDQLARAERAMSELQESTRS